MSLESKLQIRLKNQLFEDLKRTVEEEHTSVSDVLRKAITKYLKERGTATKQVPSQSGIVIVRKNDEFEF